jgi:16S rRNA (cytidine1402-2'-O)-methyltransferase
VPWNALLSGARRRTTDVLYLVSTPIGNLGDMSFRAVEVLRGADRILAEDTRRTSILLRHFDIEGRPLAAHEHNEASRAEDVARWLGEGLSVALVSDAGTPLLSDPGSRIVKRAIAEGHTVIPVPGASALLAALAGAGLSTERFTFFGFPERSGRARKETMAEIAALTHTAVLYESPRRLAALLAELAESAAGERRAVVARELTKVHEEFARGTLAELAARYADDPPLGEVVVLVEGAAAAAGHGAEAVERAAAALLADGLTPSAAAKELRTALGVGRNEAYEAALRAAARGAAE